MRSPHRRCQHAHTEKAGTRKLLVGPAMAFAVRLQRCTAAQQAVVGLLPDSGANYREPPDAFPTLLLPASRF